MDEKRRRKAVQRRRARRRKPQYKGLGLAGKILAVIELIVSVVFFAILWMAGLIPAKFLTVIGVFLLVCFAICLGLPFTKKKYYMIIGICLSIGLILILGMGAYYVNEMDTAMEKMGGATYKTDNMVVVVRSDDKAQELIDAKDYTFGYQTQIDQLNTNRMIDNVRRVLDKKPELKEYGTMEEVARALLNGEVDAVIYNEAFNGMIMETVPEYEASIRVLYQYGIETEIEVEEKHSVEEPFNVYISGIDVEGPITKSSRSDVNIIMTVNPKTKQILLSTTPRDYYVQIPEISGSKKDKLTHAGIYGVDRSMATLEALYDVDLHYYARVNFTSLIKIIDELGGVDVNSEVAFTVGRYSFKKGINHLDGDAALVFSRERHAFSAGDNQRGRNQEAVIAAIINKACSPAILKNASKLIERVGDSVETNMEKEEMNTLIRMQLEDGAPWKILSESATGVGDSKACYSSGSQILYVMQPDFKSVSTISDKIKKVMNGETIQ